LIADEIVTGLGRTGWLLAIAREGVNPDVLVLGNVLGAGLLPMGAYVTTKAINDRVYGRRTPVLHGSTTGGNPAACVAALAVLRVIEEDDVCSRSRRLGQCLDRALREVHRGWSSKLGVPVTAGLLASIPVRDSRTAPLIQAEALGRGVLVGVQGTAGGPAWLTVRPPLLITASELQSGLDSLVQAVDAVLGSPQPKATAP